MTTANETATTAETTTAETITEINAQELQDGDTIEYAASGRRVTVIVHRNAERRIIGYSPSWGPFRYVKPTTTVRRVDTIEVNAAGELELPTTEEEEREAFAESMAEMLNRAIFEADPDERAAAAGELLGAIACDAYTTATTRQLLEDVAQRAGLTE